MFLAIDFEDWPKRLSALCIVVPMYCPIANLTVFICACFTIWCWFIYFCGCPLIFARIYWICAGKTLWFPFCWTSLRGRCHCAFLQVIPIFFSSLFGQRSVFLRTINNCLTLNFAQHIKTVCFWIDFYAFKAYSAYTNNKARTDPNTAQPKSVQIEYTDHNHIACVKRV